MSPMSIKTRRLIALLLIFPLVLAACEGISEADAEEAVKAYFEGDRATANQHFCDEDHMTDEDAEQIEHSGIQDVSVDCTEDGDQMECDVEMTVGGTDVAQRYTFDIEDSKLCGGELSQ